MASKKSLYEILEVAPDATYPEIRASHEARLKALESRQQILGRDDYNMQLSLLKVAFNTLSSPSSRDAYDALQINRSQPAKSKSALLVVPPSDPAGAAALRADAMLLRAEALALRADAMGLKADVGSGLPVPKEESPVQASVRRLLTSLKTLLLTLGTLAAIGMVLKVVFLSTASRPGVEAGGASGSADDKVFFQEYYQTYGVRPASRAEAALMDAERRKSEEAARAQRMQETAQQKTVQAEQKFEDDARRRAEQVSSELRYTEERAREAQQAEERRAEEAKRMREEAEIQRREAEQEKWRRTLTPYGNQ